MGRVAQADNAALGELYDRYNRLVFGVALAVVGDRGPAEEIMLDVFVLVWKRAATYRPDRARVSTWLIAIARNHAIDFLRHLGTRPESRSVSWDLLPAQTGHIGREMEDHVDSSMRRERIQAAIAQLPTDQQEALALAYFGGHTHQQISTLLDLPLGTVKTRIRLAMQKLRDMLQEEHKSD